MSFRAIRIFGACYDLINEYKQLLLVRSEPEPGKTAKSKD